MIGTRWLRWREWTGESPRAVAALVPTVMRWGFCIALALIFGASNAQADFVFDLGTGNSAISGYSGPYEHVDVHWVNSTTATVTFTSLTSGGNIYLMGDGASIALNVNSTNFTASNIQGTNPNSTFSLWSLANTNSGQPQGFGNFNFTVKSFDGFAHATDKMTVTLTNNNGTWSSASQVLTGNGSGYLAAAHVFVTKNPANQANGAIVTGYAAGDGSGGTNPGGGAVPTPPSVVLLGIGGLCLAAFMIRSRRRLTASA